jgi:Acetoacetate decarboxylase (ADC)
MKIPRRIKRQEGRHALVDGIPFKLPITSEDSPALMAVYSIDAQRAADLLPGDDVHPFRISRDRGLLVITVINYEITNIGKYVEFSVAIACTYGEQAAAPLVPGLLRGRHGTGQFVIDLPVSSEVSVKGGKGVWGMPKHQANLDFVIAEKTVSSQYDLDGQLAVRIEIDKPRFAGFPVAASAVNWCAFRGMLFKSFIYFRGKGGINRPLSRTGRLEIGPHPRVAPLKQLDIAERPLLTGWLPTTAGILDDHVESWMMSFAEPPSEQPEGMESVVNLTLSQDWLAPPDDPALEREDTREPLTTR